MAESRHLKYDIFLNLFVSRLVHRNSSSGTGVSVANVGGGDPIVNAGGVLWWPGKWAIKGLGVG